MQTPPKKGVQALLRQVRGLAIEEKSDCPTQQKQFTSRINPIKSKRQAQKKEGFVWMACFNDLVSPNNFSKLVQALPKEARRMPTESLHLHIRDFELAFAVNSKYETTEMNFACVKRSPGKIVFAQVYLLEVVQF